MADKSLIEWTDATWNPIRARTPVTGRLGWFCIHESEGCRNCYAERFNAKLGTGVAFKAQNRDQVEVFLDSKALGRPLQWRDARMIFVGSMTDIFADFVTDEQLDRIFAVMALAQRHTFQVLTKRALRMRRYWSSPETRRRIAALLDWLKPSSLWNGNVVQARRYLEAGILPNVWMGVSAEDQAAADIRVPDLLQTPAAIRFLSAEPLLADIQLTRVGRYDDLGKEVCLDALKGHRLTGKSRLADGFFREAWSPGLDWVIAGGESGAAARPMDPDWARRLRDDCADAGVPFLFKQWGEFKPTDAGPRRVGKKVAGRHLDGQIHHQFPQLQEASHVA